MPFFGDIAKTAKDLITGGFSYDNKYSCDVKTAGIVSDGLKLSGAVVQKNGEGDPTGSFKLTYELLQDLVVEFEGALPSGKVTASLSHAGAVPGFKASLSGQAADVSTAKLAMQLLRSGAGVKCDMTEIVSGNSLNCPKVDVSAAYFAGDVALGVSAVVDSRTGTLGKYAVAAQVKAEEHTLAASLADMDTVKASWVMAVDRRTSAGVECVYKVKKGDASVSGSAAVSTKIHPMCSGKLVVASPLPIKGAKLAPVVSMQVSGEVAAKTTAAFSLQVEALTRKYKYGVQFATKV